MSNAASRLNVSRKALCVLIAAGTFAPVVSHAIVTVESVVRQYDDGSTKVFSPSVDANATFNEDKSKISAGWAQDVLTSASSDVVTYSSRGVIDDKRTEYSSGVETAIPDGTIAVGYVQSDEDDYHSRIVSAGLTREFFQKNSVVGIGFSDGNDRINNAVDPSFERAMRHQNYSISLTQVLSKTSLLQLLYDLRIESGFIASPYRRAKFVDAGGGISTRSENHPLTRNRNALALKYNLFLTSLNIATGTTYRLYQDSWGVLSHTLEERITRDLTRKLALSLTLRYYTQAKSKFYEDYYFDSSQVFYTGNTTLAAYDSIQIGLRPTYLINDKIELTAKVERYIQNFKDAIDAGPQFATMADDKKLDLSATVIGIGLNAKF